MLLVHISRIFHNSMLCELLASIMQRLLGAKKLCCLCSTRTLVEGTYGCEDGPFPPDYAGNGIIFSPLVHDAETIFSFSIMCMLLDCVLSSDPS